MSKLQQREGERSAFSVPRRSFVPPKRDVGLKRGGSSSATMLLRGVGDVGGFPTNPASGRLLRQIRWAFEAHAVDVLTTHDLLEWCTSPRSLRSARWTR